MKLFKTNTLLATVLLAFAASTFEIELERKP
jgi:hypothetical protein